MIVYSDKSIEGFREYYIPEDPVTWPFYPIVVPLTADGDGPASVGEDADRLTWEVWDRFCADHGSFDNLPAAIKHAMTLNKKLFEQGVNPG